MRTYCGTKFGLIRAARWEWMRKEVIADDGRSVPGDDKVVACGGEISTGRAPIYQTLPLLPFPPPSALPIITGCQPKSGIQVRSCRKIWLAFDQRRNSVTRCLWCSEVIYDQFRKIKKLEILFLESFGNIFQIKWYVSLYVRVHSQGYILKYNCAKIISQRSPTCSINTYIYHFSITYRIYYKKSFKEDIVSLSIVIFEVAKDTLLMHFHLSHKKSKIHISFFFHTTHSTVEPKQCVAAAIIIRRAISDTYAICHRAKKSEVSVLFHGRINTSYGSAWRGMQRAVIHHTRRCAPPSPRRHALAPYDRTYARARRASS